MRTCDLLVYRLYRGDATSQHTFELARILGEMGIRPAIHSNYPLGDLPPDIRVIARQSSYASYLADADLTILQYPMWFPLAERFRSAGGARVFWYHGVTPPEHWPVPQERDLLQTSQVRTELANSAHIAVATSPFTAAELQAHSGLQADRLRIVPLGVDVQAFAECPPEGTLSELRNHWRLQNKRVILYVGRIAGNKRIDLMLDAVANLTPGYPDLHLLIVGDDRDGIATQALSAELRRHAESLAIADRVTFTGRVPDVVPYYHLADVYVQASQHEGFGVPLVEAMAAGLPVVASASGAMPWLLNANTAGTDPCGLLFEAGDARRLSEAIERIINHPNLRRILVDRGRARARQFDTQAFRVRAALALCEALEMHAAGTAAPETDRQRAALYRYADVMPRAHVATSRIPLLGESFAKLRAASTVHLKEAYFDRVMERQVSFNRKLAEEIGRLESELPASAAERPLAPDAP